MSSYTFKHTLLAYTYTRMTFVLRDMTHRIKKRHYRVWLLGGRFEKAFMDVRVFNPSAQSNRRGPLTSVYRRHELEKKRQYDQRIREVERATFTPLVMSVTGGMGKSATVFYKRLASMLRNISYSQSIGFVAK